MHTCENIVDNIRTFISKIFFMLFMPDQVLNVAHCRLHHTPSIKNALLINIDHKSTSLVQNFSIFRHILALQSTLSKYTVPTFISLNVRNKFGA